MWFPFCHPLSLILQPRRFRRVWRHTTRVGLPRRSRLLFTPFLSFYLGFRRLFSFVFLSFVRGLRRPLLCLFASLPGYRRILILSPFLFRSRAFARPFPIPFSLVVSANSLTGLPNLVRAWFLLYGGSIPLQWSPDLEDHTFFYYKRRRSYPFISLSKKYHGYFISRFKFLVVQENKLTLVEEVVKSKWVPSGNGRDTLAVRDAI